MKKLIAGMLCAACAPLASAAGQDVCMTLLVGSYSQPGDSALKAYSFCPADASARLLCAAPVSNASFLAIGPDGTIYAASETGAESSTLSTLRFDAGEPSFEVLGVQAVGGDSPCYVNVTPDGRFVVTANYGDGTVSIFLIGADGVLGQRSRLIRFEGSGPVESRQRGSHPHCIAFTPDGRYMLVDDLGTDRIHQFILIDGDTAPVADRPDFEVVIKPGSGPRHIEFNRSGDTAYLLNEISDSVTVLRYDGAALRPVQYVAADTAQAHGAGDIHLSPDGKRLYASLRLRHEGIATFDVDTSTGLLTYRSHTPTGGHPRNFTISPDGRLMFVACRDADAVEIYAIAPDGSLSKIGSISQPRAVFVRLLD